MSNSSPPDPGGAASGSTTRAVPVQSDGRGDAVAHIAVSLAAVVYLAWELSFRGVYQYTTSIYDISDADEWRYTACSRLVAHGYSMFDQVFSAQPPLLFASLAAGMRTVSDSIAGARAVEIAAGLLTLFCVAWIAWLLAGRVAAGAAALLLAMSPGFLVYSHTVEAEGPMMAFGTLSLALLLASRRWRVLVLPAGIVLAAAVLVKLFALALVLPALWILWCGGTSPRRRLHDAALYLGALLVPVVVELGMLAPSAQWDQVVTMHNRAAAAHLPNLTPSGLVLWHFFTLDAGLSVLAVAGLVLLLAEHRMEHGGLLGLWLIGQAVMLLLFRPLFPHHPAIVLSSLGVCAGVCCARAWEVVRRPSWRPAALLLVPAALWCVFAVRLVHDDRHLLYSAANPVAAQQAAFLDAHVSPRQFIAVDDLALADAAHRLVVPPLCDPSNVRLASGYLTGPEAIAAMKKYHPKVVLPTLGIYRQVPGLVPWLRGHLRPVLAPGGQTGYVAP